MKNSLFGKSLSISIVLIGLLTKSSIAASFQGLGDLPGGQFTSAAHSISADGSVVVGHSFSDLGGEAFRWTQEEGMVGLGFLPSGESNFSRAIGVSADGSVIVGNSSSTLDTEPFRWTQEEGMVGLGLLPGYVYSEAYDISADGSVIVGVTRSNNPLDFQAVRWMESGGIEGLGFLPGGTTSFATSVSADGSVIVGGSRSSFGSQAFRWTETGGMEGLGFLTGDRASRADGVSADGSVIVGNSVRTDHWTPFRWTESGGMEGLDVLPGGDISIVEDVSADGSVVFGGGLGVYFIWDSINGTRNLTTVLENDFGLDLTGWRNVRATAISDDNLTLVGFGTNPQGHSEAWIARLDSDSESVPESSTIPGLAIVLGSGTFLKREHSKKPKKSQLSLL